MNKKTLLILLITLLLLTSLILSGCNQPPSVEPINAKGDVPAVVWDAFAEKSIKPGAYYFSPAFTESNEGYLIICGSKDYADGYDVKVEEVEFRTGSTEEGTVLNGYYDIKFTESVSSSFPDYSKDSEYPFVIFKLSRQSPYDLIGKIMSNGEETAINYWWGKGEISGKNSLFIYEVIQTKEGIPDAIWSKICTLNLEKGIFSFNQREYDPEAFYALIVGGEDYTNSYNIAFERVRYSNVIGENYPVDAFVRLYMRQYADKGTIPYAEGFDLPFAVIKLEPREKDKSITLMGGYNHHIKVFDDHNMVESDLMTNRDMES